MSNVLIVLFNFSINFQVKKDVLRTDRCHSFYATSGDENPNVIALLNILTTFALNHRVNYCQGMSDLASPLLYAMKEESHAYMCFCALMNRLSENFSSDGEAITQKFENLSTLLQYYDPDFYLYLKKNGVHDLLFCYRWIMLELKREFAFDDTLYMLEVLWSSIPPISIDDLSLFDPDYKFIAGQYSLKSNLEFYLISKPTCSTQDSANCIANSNHNFKHCHTLKNNHTNLYLDSKDLNQTQRFKFQCRDLEDSGSIKFRKDNKKSKTQYFVRPSSSNYYTPLYNSLPNSHPTSRPRTLRFLPTLLSTDSHEIDSPEAEAYEQPFSFPPRLIDKQYSIENDYDNNYEPNRDMMNTKPSQRLESINESHVRVNKSKLSRQSNFDHGDELNKLDALVHCNGECSDMIIDSSKEWPIPRGLIRNESLDSFKNLKLETNETLINTNIEHSQRFEKEKSEGYESGSTSEVPFDCNDNKSLSSSCSSLVMLSNEALPDSNRVATLPSPIQLGYNNAFMLFLCLTLLLQHRDKIMSSKMDSNEIGVYFDSYVRRHDVHNVLNYARQLFYSYLSHWHQNTSDDELQFYNSLDLV